MEAARKLYAIVDGRGRSSFPELDSLVSVNVVNIRDLPGKTIPSDGPILIDADLRDIKCSDLLLAHLPKRAGTTLRIVVVEPSSPAAIMQAKALGASDFLKRPLDIQELRRCLTSRFAREAAAPPPPARPRFRSAAAAPGGVSIDSGAKALDSMFGALENNGALDMTAASKAGEDIVDAVGELGISKWLSTVRAYHAGTFQHCLIVTGLATSFAHRTGMRRADVLTLTMAGLLHDIGKAKIPLAILDKPGPLTHDEAETLKTHAALGHDYLVSKSATPRAVLSAVRHHHEYLDGSGYPDGLSGAKIDDVTRILTVCDVYGALVEERAYRPRTSHVDAVAILTEMARAGKIDADLVRVFVAR